MEILTREQYEAAVRLALAHGHEWAWAEEGWSPCFYRVEGAEGQEMCAADEIVLHTLSCRRASSSIPGIVSPELDEEGAVVHDTVTGRLSWRISPDGVIVLRVYRPAGLVAEARRVDGRWSAVRLSPSVPFYERHADALLVALRALDAPEEIRAKVQGWAIPPASPIPQRRRGG